MLSEPKVEERAAQPYVGIRRQVPMSELPEVIPATHGQVYSWLKEHDIAPTDAPFIRYNVIDMAGLLDVELGVPVADGVQGEGEVQASTLPAGNYATVLYTGDYSGLMDANGALIDWGASQKLKWDSHTTEQGDAFGSRYEVYITDPSNEPDPAKWRTEVAIRLADDES